MAHENASCSCRCVLQRARHLDGRCDPKALQGGWGHREEVCECLSFLLCLLFLSQQTKIIFKFNWANTIFQGSHQPPKKAPWPLSLVPEFKILPDLSPFPLPVNKDQNASPENYKALVLVWRPFINPLGGYAFVFFYN